MVRLNWRTLKSWCHKNLLCHKEPKRTLKLTFNLFPNISHRKTVLEIHSCWHMLTGWQLRRNHAHTLLLSFTFGLTKTELSPQPIWVRDKPQINLTVHFMLTLHSEKRTVSWDLIFSIHLLTAQLSFWFPASLPCSLARRLNHYEATL